MARSNAKPMLYLAVDVDLLDEDWWLDASSADRGAWLTASLLSKRRMSDGIVSLRLLEREGIDRGQVDRLAAAGRFELVDDGQVLVVGFTDTNMTRAEYEAQKADARERQKRSRARRQDPVTSDDGPVTRDADVSHDGQMVTSGDPAQRERSDRESEATPSHRIERLADRLVAAKIAAEGPQAKNPEAFATWCRRTWRTAQGTQLVADAIAAHPDHDDDTIVAALTHPPRRASTTTTPFDESDHPVIKRARLAQQQAASADSDHAA